MERNQFAQMMCDRTKSIAVQVIKIVTNFPKKSEYYIIGKQVLRSATSTAANYRAVTRARSKKEFYSKLSITIEECDETLFWFEILEESKLVSSASLISVKNETTEILKILSKARKNTKFQ